MTTPQFDATQTGRLLPFAALVSAIATAARELQANAILAPQRQVLAIDASSALLCMPAIARDIGVTKLITVHANNKARGWPTIQGELTVFETTTGRRLAMLDGPTVTARRTAAVTLLGIEVLLPSPPASALLIGTGNQARTHAQALVQHFSVATIHVAASSPAKAQAFCEELGAMHPHTRFMALSEPPTNIAPPEVDVVIALTTSTQPVIPQQLSQRTLVVGVGAFRPDMAEIPAELLHSRLVVVDDIVGAQHEAGDLLRAGVDWNAARSLASMLDGAHPASTTAPVLKTVGQAAWDLAAARVALANC
jgi:1-piperideine-2-carboxylate/1-pyrroline-2-carboxylate reductase [NAD(P)H]